MVMSREQVGRFNTDNMKLIFSLHSIESKLKRVEKKSVAKYCNILPHDAISITPKVMDFGGFMSHQK